MNRVSGRNLLSLSLAIAMVGCLGESDGTDESDNDEVEQAEETIAPRAYTATPEGGGTYIKVCECTNVYKRCSGDYYLAQGRTCSWSDGSGTCPGGYPAVCGGSGSPNQPN